MTRVFMHESLLFASWIRPPNSNAISASTTSSPYATRFFSRLTLRSILVSVSSASFSRNGSFRTLFSFRAKTNYINNPAHKTLSSYGYILMLIHFLQSAVSPPLLPILQVLLFPCSHPQELPPDWDGGPVPRNARRPQIPIESYQKTLYDTYFYCPKHLDLLCRYAKQNTMTVGELLLKFFYFYAFEFDYYHAVVSVRQRGFLDREEKSWRCLWKMQMQLCIEDPFEDDYDVAHVITPHTSQIILQCFAVREK